MFDKPMWCCMCEQEVLEKIHPEYFGVWEGEVIFDWCDGEIICTCPPPELQENWDEYLQEPTEEELEIIEHNAEWMMD